jgi:hypothetical protein
MKKLLSLGALSLFFAMSALSGSTPSGSQDRDLDQGIRDRFIGAWRLAWLEEDYYNCNNESEEDTRRVL